MFFQALPASFPGLSGSLLMMLPSRTLFIQVSLSLPRFLKAIPAPNSEECSIATKIPFEICFFIAYPASVSGAFSLKKRSGTITASDL